MDRSREAHGVTVDKFAVAVSLDPFMSIRALSAYAGLSVRSLRGFLVGGTKPLPHYRVGGKVLVRRSEFDSWMLKFRVNRTADVDAIVNEIAADLGVGAVQR